MSSLCNLPVPLSHYHKLKQKCKLKIKEAFLSHTPPPPPSV
ncbi:hypothetical protein [Campylobacter upsaliensis]|nr:hypothetical protein [Campylobacter upsaliensis]